MKLEPELAQSGWTFLTRTESVGAIFRSNGFGRRLLVTFDALSDFNYGRKQVTAEKIALSCEADHLHICTSLTNWFQSPDLFVVIDSCRQQRDQYDEAILYGHSMGAYGALLLSGPLAATNVVAFVPQFSVDRRKVPFENRFDRFVFNTDFCFDDMISSISKTAPKHIVFDPYFEIDRKHFDLFAHVNGIVPVRIPFSGHYPGQLLKQAGILRKTVLSLLLQSASHIDRRKNIRAGRRRSQRYFLELSSYFARRHQLKAAFKSVNAAYVLDRNSSTIMEVYQALLQLDPVYNGVAHAMVRLLLKERPDMEIWYAGTRDLLWLELQKSARPIIGDPAGDEDREVK